jgi:hypothetical protein
MSHLPAKEEMMAQALCMNNRGIEKSLSMYQLVDVLEVEEMDPNHPDHHLLYIPSLDLCFYKHRFGILPG